MGDYLVVRRQAKPEPWHKKKRTILSRIYTNQVYDHKRRNRPLPAYTRQELIDRFVNDKRFIRLVNEWIKSGCMIYKKPTIDRIDCRRPYTMQNIHIMTWEENQFKRLFELKYFHPNCMSVAAYKDGVLVRIYRTQAEAGRKLGIQQNNISSVIRGIGKTLGGFEWRRYHATNR